MAESITGRRYKKSVLTTSTAEQRLTVTLADLRSGIGQAATEVLSGFGRVTLVAGDAGSGSSDTPGLYTLEFAWSINRSTNENPTLKKRTISADPGTGGADYSDFDVDRSTTEIWVEWTPNSSTARQWVCLLEMFSSDLATAV